MFAPLVMHTKFFPSIPCLSTYFFIPATASAPAGCEEEKNKAGKRRKMGG